MLDNHHNALPQSCSILIVFDFILTFPKWFLLYQTVKYVLQQIFKHVDMCIITYDMIFGLLFV